MCTAAQSIREIVTRQPSAAKIFHRFDIDLCLQADLSLERACQELQLSVDQILEKLADAEAQECGGVALDPDDLSLGRLIQHIVRVHHNCVRQELPRCAEMASKVAMKRSDRAPELAKIAELIEKLRDEMYAHIQKEEQVLFPFISQMDQEHESADHLMMELRLLTNHFEPPSWACATHIVLLSGLREFETDLKQHVRLENDVLFPRAIQLESGLKARN
jgi:regulator of cell morphogenesis and NO signaling